MARFEHFELNILEPKFDSDLVQIIIDLEKISSRRLRGTTPFEIFQELKAIFQHLESLGSARIEGNHTTIADYFEIKSGEKRSSSETIQEIENIEDAIEYIERCVHPGFEITHTFIHELHALAVSRLTKEGDRTPGAYRQINVAIKNAEHMPPDMSTVRSYMDELISFLNKDVPERYNFIRIAQAHHRFAWIHPYGNGNGRTVRLLTYALLIKYNLIAGRTVVITPNAVFWKNREKYNENLAIADNGKSESIEAWCIYMLSGMCEHLSQIHRLTEYDVIVQEILVPTIEYAFKKNDISTDEYKVLNEAVNKKIIQLSDLEEIFPDMEVRQRMYLLNKMKNKKLLCSSRGYKRKYVLCVMNAHLIKGLIHVLVKNNYAPQLLPIEKLEDDL